MLLFEEFRPIIFCWVTNNLTNQLELMNLGASLEEWSPLFQKLSYNAANRPDIDLTAIFFDLQQYLWSSIPERHNFASERFVRLF